MQFVPLQHGNIQNPELNICKEKETAKKFFFICEINSRNMVSRF